MARLLAIALLMTAFVGTDRALAEPPFSVNVMLEGLEHPWAIAFLPDGDWLISERGGRLRHVRDGELLPEPVTGLPPVAAGGQGGLMDIALHPNFAENRLVYFTWSRGRSEDGHRSTALGRGEWRDGKLQSFQELFVADAWARGGRHFGSRLLFDDDGYLFMTVGDRGDRDRAQDPRNHAGTTLRLNDDGSAAAGNPFIGSDDGADEVWSYGHRNAQGMALHPKTREVWQHEHGPRGGDEINRIQRGKNYGWPETTYGREYWGPRIGATTKPGMEPPLKQWTPSIAPSGMAFYQGDAFPQWNGDIFVGALALQHVARLRFDDQQEVEEEQLLDGEDRIRDVRTGPDGFIYLLTDQRDGRLLRLEPR